MRCVSGDLGEVIWVGDWICAVEEGSAYPGQGGVMVHGWMIGYAQLKRVPHTRVR